MAGARVWGQGRQENRRRKEALKHKREAAKATKKTAALAAPPATTTAQPPLNVTAATDPNCLLADPVEFPPAPHINLAGPKSSLYITACTNPNSPQVSLGSCGGSCQCDSSLRSSVTAFSIAVAGLTSFMAKYGTPWTRHTVSVL